METTQEHYLIPRCTPGAKVLSSGECAWRLEIPAGPAGAYRLAQLDDYASLQRSAFRWKSPIHMHLRARSCLQDIPGTWGFGLWNNPFSAALFDGIDRFQLPTLPNAAWFFFASPHNYLSLEDNLPAHGSLAGTFQSPSPPAVLRALTLVCTPFLFIHSFTQAARRVGRRWVKQSAIRLNVDPTCWHSYDLTWQAEICRLKVDDQLVLETHFTPRGPLALVIWLDNQYAAFAPYERPRWGTLANPEIAWIEISDFNLQCQAG